jgi:hypothetical protein
MSCKKSQYSSPAAWREAAMQRSAAIDTAESSHRAAIAHAHNQQQDTSDADSLADQQLYIQGKMDMEEYQDYLLFKHANVSSR